MPKVRLYHIKKLFSLTKPYLWLVLIGFVFIVIDVIFHIATVVIAKKYFTAIEAKQFEYLVRLVKITSFSLIAFLIVIFCGHFTRNAASFFIDRDLSLTYLEKLSNLPLKDSEKFHSGDLLNLFSGGLWKLHSIIYNNSYLLITNLLIALAAFSYLLIINWHISIIAILSGPTIYLLVRFFDDKILKLTQEINKKSGLIYAYIQETLKYSAFIKTNNLQEVTLTKYDLIRKSVLPKEIIESIYRDLFNLSTDIVSNLVLVFAGTAICFLTVKGYLSISLMVVYILLITKSKQPFLAISKTWGSIQEGLAVTERIFSILDIPIDICPSKEAIIQKHNPLEQTIMEISNLTFRHEKNQLVFQNLNMQIYQGETLAIVGQSGSGKTTLARLCLGLYEPQEGSITFLGYDLVKNGAVLRNYIAYVPQNTYLFTGSFRDNIALGNPHAKEDDIIQAAVLANAWDFISKLPQQLDTHIGEQGSELSEGQKQRIALARAFIKKAPLLILDEATSALDIESEQLVKNAIVNLCTQQTTLIIAHRLSTIKNATRIIVLDKGKIIEEGTHQSLIHKKGKYAKLYA